MRGLKKAIIVAGSVFILSSLIGLVSSVNFLALLLRALFLSAGFFGLVVGIYFLFERFIPELLDSSALPQGDQDEGADFSDADDIGSRFDVTVGDDEELASLQSVDEDEEIDTLETVDEELGELDAQSEVAAQSSVAAQSLIAIEPENASILKNALDRSEESDYTTTEEPFKQDSDVGKSSSPLSKNTAESVAVPLPGFHDVDQLPDLDGFADSFAPLSASADEQEQSEGTASTASLQSGRSLTLDSGKASNFDTGELVSAIQTMLKKE